MTQNGLPGLTPARAFALAGTWDDGGLWEDVLWLAQRCWQADEATPLPVRWHHLVLAVGNFKRQSGRRLRPGRLSDSTNSRTASAEQFVLPGGSAIHRDSQESWRQLEAALPGAALATTTTLLSALWPDDHFVFDWRVEAAANALRIDAGLPATRWAESEMEGRKRTTSDFSDYATVRSWLREIDCPLNSLERALYRLSQKVPSVKGRSWPDYASAVANVLQRCDE